MLNPFQDSYTQRLKSWRDLRNRIANSSIEQSCVEVDKWWQQAPLVQHHLHWNDISNWPDPWALLSENTYCLLTRALGMVYTLLMSEIEPSLVEATDDHGGSHYLVIVDEYVLNYWPGTVLTNKVSDFTITRHLNISPTKDRIK